MNGVYVHKTNYTPEVIQWMRVHKDEPMAVQQDAIEKLFGFRTSEGHFVQVRMLNGISPRRGGKNWGNHTSIFTPEMRKEIHDNQYILDNSAMAEHLNRKYGTAYTRKQIQLYRHKHGEVYRRYPPEMIEWAKTSKVMALDKDRFYTAYCKKWKRNDDIRIVTAWRSYIGASPYRAQNCTGKRGKPVGSIRYRHSHPHEDCARTVKEIKTEKGWTTYSRYMWEQYHHEELPKGMVVFHLNQDEDDYSEENLVAVKTSLMGIINSSGLTGTNPESNDVVLKLAELKHRISELKTQREEKK